MDRERTKELIAIVDDDESARSAIYGVLRSFGFNPQSFSTAEEFLASGRQNEAACLITDIRMPGMSGLELQGTLAEKGCRIPIIFVTAYGDARTRAQALRGGAIVLLDKPFDDKVLIERVRSALAN